MAKVVAIDAGTTGVRALVVDERARVADVAYRELTQHFPRPGWVEHDPAEIWDAVRATLAEVGDRLARAGDTVAAIGITNQRETLVAFDRSTGRPLHRAIVWQDRRTAALCAELTGAGHLPLVRETDGPRPRPLLQRHQGGLAAALRRAPARAPATPNLSFCTVDTWVLWNLTGGPSGGAYATDPSNASRTLLLDTATLAWSPELCDLFGVPRAHPARRAPVGRPFRRRRARPTSGPRRRCSTASRSRASSATSRPRSSGRPASIPAWSRSPTARAASCWPTPDPSARPRPTA